MKERIAFISEHASPLATLGGVDSGGQNVYVDKLAKQLADFGYEVDVFTRWDNPAFGQAVSFYPGARVIHIQAGPKQPLAKEKILPFIGEFTDNIASFIKAERKGYKIIHANFFMSALSAADLKKKFGIPFVVIFHALGKVRRQFQGSADGFPDERFAIEQRVISEADRIIAECPQDQKDLINLYHAPPEKITIIPCGFDPKEFYPLDKSLARSVLGLGQEEKIVLQLGRMVPRKGVDNVIRGISLLAKKHSIIARLLVVGGESEDPDPALTPEIGRLQQVAKAEGVEKQVVFVGRRDPQKLKFYYNAADLFVSTPWYESFGITPLEAMACRIPVIGSRVGGIKFTVPDHKTGLLVSPNDPVELADKMRTLLSSEAARVRLGSNGLKRVNSHFTWEMVAKRLEVLYREVAAFGFAAPQSRAESAALVERNFASLLSVVRRSERVLPISLLQAAQVIGNCLERGGKVLICGNGGSAADSQHFAAELVGHFLASQREGLPAISLASDPSVLTAVGNDFGFDRIFSRQVESYGKKGDVLVGISTSGNSANLAEAFRAGSQKGLICIGLLGKSGGELAGLSDLSIVVPSGNTQNIQEIHTHLIHTICELVERRVTGRKEKKLVEISETGQVLGDLPLFQEGAHFMEPDL